MAPSRACSASMLWGATRNGRASAAPALAAPSAGLRRASSIMTREVGGFACARQRHLPRSACERWRFPRSPQSAVATARGQRTLRSGRLPSGPASHAKIKVRSCPDHAPIMALRGPARPQDATGRLFARHARALRAFVLDDAALDVEHVVAGNRQAAHALGELHLEHHEVLMAEGGLGSGKVELPHPAERLIADGCGLLPVGKEALAPGP